jgi:hypothetical protein
MVTTYQVDRSPSDLPASDLESDPDLSVDPLAKASSPRRLRKRALVQSEIRTTARDGSAPDRWHMDLRVGVDFPLALSGRLVLQTPGRLRIMVDAGGLPESFEDLGHSLLMTMGLYDASVGQLIDDAIAAPLIGAVSVGFGPKKKSGLVFDAGYRAIWMSTGPVVAPIFSMVSGQQVPASYDIFSDGDATLNTTLHQIVVRAGWEWLAADRLAIRLDVGGSFTFEASHRMRISAERELPEGFTEFVELAEQELDRILQRRGHVPTVGVSLGYRFF